MSDENDERTDEEVQQEWDEWVPDLVEGIEQGWLDEHLRTLGLALFARRDVIAPDAAVKTGSDSPTRRVRREPAKPADAGLSPARNGDGDPDPDPSKARGGVAKGKGSSFGNSANIKRALEKPISRLARPVKPVTDDKIQPDKKLPHATVTIPFTGSPRNYLREKLVGKSFKLPEIDGTPGLKGKLVQIIGVGPQNIMIAFREDPGTVCPSAYRTAWENKQARYLPWKHFVGIVVDLV